VIRVEHLVVEPLQSALGNRDQAHRDVEAEPTVRRLFDCVG
jgi:hypothetical protein